MSEPTPQRFLARVARATFLHPAGLVALGLWIAAHVAVLALAGGYLPFDRPAVAQLPFAVQVAVPTIGMVEVLLLMLVVYGLTRRRVVDIAARAPDRRRAGWEVGLLLTYAMLAQVGGWLLGPALGYRPFSFHVAGTLFGCSVPATPGEIWTWMTYNFVAFALLPYLWFRRRYSRESLNLTSSAPRNDLLVILVVLAIETAFELSAFPGILSLSPRELAAAAPLAFVIFFLGTVLPTMVLIYAILLPRYLKLTGSPTVTVLLGGLTYAAMHLVEGWSLFDTARDTALSLLFVALGYVGPGMIKSFITLRTGNAWVHALGYHAVAPHVVADAPMIGKVFGVL
ncbi:hypothetical protein [Phenylobacterium sp.]|uniref:hypothetical protein n=1 Tax=Phenylobacterium sp. TaxID=1871053 RepID=UPI0030F448E5